MFDNVYNILRVLDFLTHIFVLCYACVCKYMCIHVYTHLKK